MLPQASPTPPVRITTLQEADRNKSVEVGKSLWLECEVSDPNAHVTWLKDGINLPEAPGQEMLEEGSRRILAVQSVMLSHAGTYNCKAANDAVQFHVDIKGDTNHFCFVFHINFSQSKRLSQVI